ncbi:MAG TPA: hypothetical protein VMD49_04255 [Steroidobacteraceae bacterium]|nr:hypothetical protein [Steroidobacteraceae bacterium]
MKDSGRRFSGRRALLAALVPAGFLLAAVAVLAAARAAAQPNGAPPAPGTAQPAHWVQKKINFGYLGFTTHYSCEGLTDKVREILLELGARKSTLNVHEFGCTVRLGAPAPFPSVAGTFEVLEPLTSQSEAGSAGSGAVVAAHWQPVNVRFDHAGLDMDGQCELLEQVKSHIVPLVTARNVQFKSTCVPYELTPGGTSLRLEVLVPDVNPARRG